jgi:hypothetical protein
MGMKRSASPHLAAPLAGWLRQADGERVALICKVPVIREDAFTNTSFLN